VGPAPTAEAGRAAKFQQQSTSLFCELSGDDGTAFVYAEANSVWGDFVAVDFYDTEADPGDWPPTLFGWTHELDLTADRSQMSASIELQDAEGSPAGTAELLADLAPDGPAEPVNERFRDGNRLFRYTGAFQPLAVTGTLSLPGEIEFELVDCSAGHSELSVFENNPTGVFEGVLVHCSLETDDGFLSLFGLADRHGAFTDVFFAPAEGDEVAGYGEGVLSRTQWSVSVELYEIFGAASLGTADIEADLIPSGERHTFTVQGRGYRYKVWVEPISVDGNVRLQMGDLDESLTLDDEVCWAEEFRVVARINERIGPKPGGKPPVNDTPEGALGLAVPSTQNVQTRGASPIGEAETGCLDYGDFGSVPMGYTLWYTITGTGGTITLDTAGSDFDTVVAVYVLDGADLVEVDCNDDVFLDVGHTRQAMLSLDTEAGVTYYVQAGGWTESEFGRLRLRTW
jgi:hypothetical protein